MAVGYIDQNGVYLYGEDDEVSPFSEFMNFGQRATSQALADTNTRIDALADTSWSNYAPTLARLNAGTTGVVQAEWRGDENNVDVRFSIRLGGTGFSVGMNPTFSLPTPAAAPLYSYAAYSGVGVIKIGALIFPCFPLAYIGSTTEVVLYALNPSSPGYSNIDAASPAQFAADSAMGVSFSYRPA